MNHLISAHTGHFPAKTFSGTVWLLQICSEDGLTTLTVTGLSAIPVAEWLAWARTIWPEGQLTLPRSVENGWMGSGPVISLDRTVRGGGSAKLLTPFWLSSIRFRAGGLRRSPFLRLSSGAEGLPYTVNRTPFGSAPKTAWLQIQ